MDKLIRDGRVIRGYIGISGREIAPLHAQGGGIDQLQGIVVNDVAPEGPAAQAGIRANDVIISVNDKPAVSALETMDQVAEIRPGSEIPVVIMRDDKKLRCISPSRNIRRPINRLPAGEHLSISK
jgi:serine protease DegS